MTNFTIFLSFGLREREIEGRERGGREGGEREREREREREQSHKNSIRLLTWY
jgi:hypothetical protein